MLGHIQVNWAHILLLLHTHSALSIGILILRFVLDLLLLLCLVNGHAIYRFWARYEIPYFQKCRVFALTNENRESWLAQVLLVCLIGIKSLKHLSMVLAEAKSC